MWIWRADDSVPRWVSMPPGKGRGMSTAPGLSSGDTGSPGKSGGTGGGGGGDVSVYAGRSAISAGAVEVLDPSDGSLISTETYGAGVEAIALLDGDILTGHGGGAIERRGGTNWTNTTVTSTVLRLAIDSAGNVFVGHANGNVRKLDPSDGTQLATISLGSPITGLGVGSDDSVFILEDDGNGSHYRYTNDLGTQTWSNTLASNDYVDQMVDAVNDLQYYLIEVTLISKNTAANVKTQSWFYVSDGNLKVGAIDDTGDLYVGSSNGSLMKVDASGPSEAWKQTSVVNTWANRGLFWHDGVLYIAGPNPDVVQARDPTDGSLTWSRSGPDATPYECVTAG